MTTIPSPATSAGVVRTVATGGGPRAEHAPRPASPVRLARTAGLLYLVVGVLGGFAQIVR